MISAVSASEIENKTTISIQQPNPNQDLSKISVEKDNEKLSATSDEIKLSAASKSQVITKKKTTLTAPNVNMYYKDGSKFSATLKYGKKTIGNAKVQIKINGETFTKTTDKNGKVSINLNYKSGKYSVLSICNGNNEFEKSSAKSTVTIKSTIKCGDLAKYYKNTSPYSATFYDKKGKILKNTQVKLKLNGKTYSVKTDKKGIAKLAINLKPGKYGISITNTKTSETLTKTVTIKSLIETKDLTIKEGETGKFNVKILNNNGKAAAGKKATLKVNGKTYTKTTNKNGIATLEIKLNPGKYTITTEFDGLKATNKITVNKVIKTSKFIHSTLIPNYVNVTIPHVYQNSAYSLKTGLNGIIKMPKIETFIVQTENNGYLFSTSSINGLDSIVLGYKSYFIPLDGSEMKTDTNKNNFKGTGLIISRISGYTQIDYQSNTKDNVELFGFYADRGSLNSETLTYMQNDKIMAKVNFQTQSFDEMGLKYSLAKFYQKTIYDFDYKSYDEITNHNTQSIKFANTNTPVTFSYFGKSIEGYCSKEEIITKFMVNDKEELKKTEIISYGLGENYRKTLGFEVLQSYSIINEKITKTILENWVNDNKKYLDRFGVMNVYGMHLASLETAWLADEMANSYSKEYNVNWKRGHTLTIMGGINLEDTYLNILNADMGMDVSGAEKNVLLFRLINSLNLPNLEDYALSEVEWRYKQNSTNSLENVFNSISLNRFSITQLGEMIYIFSEDTTQSVIAYNTSNGVANVLLYHNDNVYKGSTISTTKDCCSVGIMPKDIIAGIRNTLGSLSKGISEILNNAQPASYITYLVGKEILNKVLTGASSAYLGLFSTMAVVQTVGTTYRNKVVNEKEWYAVMDKYTFTRPGYLQNKKVYNIPNKNGGYDYIEVTINKDLTLDRNNAIYISNGKTKHLTKTETYQYFEGDYWTPYSIPTKYWDNSWKGVVK
ncbi:MAG: hypothetical protein IJL02_07495 [Methanobrevibacter sp.]|uniref:hypothetical protein n=1 Tax=Methanobrevibacter sp. TaxID=66852 RepID=UPI0025D4EFD5|nr:hypothetical protein [Methanobrevibacter sp.]MBQ6099690.1 hypothetical protein [Methanobrevibacter sp.]